MATEITSLAVRFSADMAGFQRGMAQVQRGVSQAEASFAGLQQNFRRVTAAVGGLAAGFAGLKIVGLAKDAAFTSARFVTLGIVMERVGRNAGYTSAQLGEYDRALRRTGISMLESRSALASLVSAQVDLAQSTKLARVAQDAAVIGGINSSEAFARMVTGIANANTVTLRTIGLNVNFEKSYQELAKSLGKSVDQLTEQERAQARTNAVLEAGVQIAGSYEAAMGSAGKQLGSISRLLSDLSTTAGRVFDEGLKRAVFGTSEALVKLNKALNDLGDDRIKAWGKTLADVLVAAKNAAVGLAVVMAGRMLLALQKTTQQTLAKAAATRASAVSASFAANTEAAAAMAVAAAHEKATAAKLAEIRATQAAIAVARQEALARLQAANAVTAQAARVPLESLRPLGGAAVEREMARRAAATRAASAATRELAILGQQEARVQREITAATAAHTAATRASTAATGAAIVAEGAHQTVLRGTTFAARAATVAVRGFNAVLGLLGGWPGVIITGLGLLAYKLMDVRSKAAEAADAVKDAIAGATAGFAELDKSATFSRLGTARKELHALEQAVADLNAQAEKEKGRKVAFADNMGRTQFKSAGVATPETLAALESAKRALEVTRGEAAALEKQYVRLATLEPPTAPLNQARHAIDQTIESYQRLAEQAAEAQEQIAALEMESAIAPMGEELDRVNKKLAETQARLAAIQAEMAKFRMASPPDAPELAVQRTATDTRLQRTDTLLQKGVAQQKATAIGPTASEAAQATIQKWLDNPAITAAALKSGEFADQLEAAKRVIAEEAKRRKELNKLLGLEVGERKIGAGDVGATVSGIGGMVGGRAGGAMSGIGSAITAAVSAANPLTAAIGVMGGAMGALTNIMGGAEAKIERARAAFDRLVSNMARKFDLLDTSTADQFAQMKAAWLEKMGEGPLRDLLAGSSQDNIQDFISEALKSIERRAELLDTAKRSGWDKTKLGHDALQEFQRLDKQLGGLSDEQVMGFLQGLKRLTDATDKATQSMLNVPKGFKAALARFNADVGRVLSGPPIPTAPPPDVTHPYAQSGIGQLTIEQITIQAEKGVDVTELWRDLKREIAREAQRGGVGGSLVFAV